MPAEEGDYAATGAGSPVGGSGRPRPGFQSRAGEAARGRRGSLAPSFYSFLLLHLEVLGARRIAVRRDLHLVFPHRPAAGLGDVELVGGGAGGSDVEVILLDHLAGVAEGPLGVELHRRRRALGSDRSVDGVLGAER